MEKGKAVIKSKSRSIIILGGGLSGLAAAWDISIKDVPILIVEKNKQMGGLAKTLVFDEFRTDIGPHRFISSNYQLIEKVKSLPMVKLHKVQRISRFFLQGKFYYYPINAKDVFSNIKLIKMVRILFDYFLEKIKGCFKKSQPKNLEEFIIRTFGKSLAYMNMLNYSEKIWGMPSREISSKWAKERIGGLSVKNVVKALFFKDLSVKTLTNDFFYPEYGIGSICEALEQQISERDNCAIAKQTYPKRIIHKHGKIVKIELMDNNGKGLEMFPGCVVSSIPLTELINLFDPALPAVVLQAASFLKYRAHLCLFLTLKKSFVFCDHWIYFPEKEIPFSRISEPKNFSQVMSPYDKSSLLIEFFCWEGDEIWRADKDALLEQILPWLEKANFIKREDVNDVFVHREKAAYPLYDIEFEKNLNLIKQYLNQFENLYLCGRRGAFKYNNLDEALEDGLDVADRICQAFNKETKRAE
ncbi:MAG: FAD-dependent oxidoreductase [Candidatus Omnitrophica bacterium]|nr:FAD-dependent oxidoreductase [Candidatus Omnitrophota bacterium]